MSNNIKIENLRPVADRVCIKPEPKESITEAGVYKPEDAKREQHFLVGEVVAVGKGTPESPMDLKVGETVMYPENVGTEISGGLVFMKESQVLTVI